MYRRFIQSRIMDALADTPVVFLRGARQTGKSTLVQAIAQGPYPAGYVTLDNAGMLSLAGVDPEGFIAGLKKPVVIDEIQRVPELFLAIKADVDRNRIPGRYILTGSADILALPGVANALAGRMEVLTLWPLCIAEINGIKRNIADALFHPDFPDFLRPSPSFDLFASLVAGGFPEPLQRKKIGRRQAWFESYITTILEREIRSLAYIQDLAAVPRLFRLIAARTATLHNQSEISRSSGIPNTTLSRYLTLLNATFLLRKFPAWSSNLGKRLVKSPKLMIVDTGLACHLTETDEAALRQGTIMAGPLFENFVAMELVKHVSWSENRMRLYHFRSQSGREVDIVIEGPLGNVAGIEVKLSATPSPRDFSGLKALRKDLGEKFVMGIVVYTGSEVIPFDRNLYAIPIDYLIH